jgi:biotin transport system substrate-specific component
MRPFRLVKYIYAGLFAAVLAILSQLAIPMPGAVPLTLQTFGVALCAYVLGWKLGTLSYLVYFLLGLAGVPVFSNFTGGIGKLFGTTGGFLVGFFFLSIGCGLCSNYRRTWKLRKNEQLLALFAGILGLLICHILGIIHVSLLTKSSFAGSFLLVSAPYLLKDFISVIAAFFLAKPLRKHIN